MDDQSQRQASTGWSPQLLDSLVQAPNLATAAAYVAGRCVPVFPCVPRGKQPLTAHGFLDASTDAEIVRSWWRRWPDANIGVPTGSASGVDVVDVDVHGAQSGFGAFERARRAGLVEDGRGWSALPPAASTPTSFAPPP